ncbi:Hypothetical protein BQ3484_151 [Cedratvirus A11]|uniref:Uncharacterized protein n=1 Tax=Cedratvirus A11 TaxID=1903266 RepID=A0A1M7XU51_9VIRU|nr:Hypothetical protein BQ3484_151 [Cedratvirus A11]SHO33219.1 Hypothetical protein BQ3484_151 [Cedratvirus A11]
MQRLTLPRRAIPGSEERVSPAATVAPSFTSPTAQTRIGALPPLNTRGSSLNPGAGTRTSLLESATTAPRTTRTFRTTTQEVVRQTTPEEVAVEYSEDEEEEDEEEIISSPIASPPRALPPITPVTRTTVTTTTTGAPRGLARLGLPSPKDVRTTAPAPAARTLSKTVTTTTSTGRQPRTVTKKVTTTRVSPTRATPILASTETRLDLVTLQIIAKIIDLPPSNDRRELTSRIIDVLSNQE